MIRSFLIINAMIMIAESVKHTSEPPLWGHALLMTTAQGLVWIAIWRTDYVNKKKD